MKFSELKIGERFEFDHSKLPITHGLERGPWVKTSHRKYEKPGMQCRVGSITTSVILLNDCKICNGQGWAIDGGSEIAYEIQRCDTCKRFDGDLEAAQAFFKYDTNFVLSRIIIVRK